MPVDFDPRSPRFQGDKHYTEDTKSLAWKIAHVPQPHIPAPVRLSKFITNYEEINALVQYSNVFPHNYLPTLQHKKEATKYEELNAGNATIQFK